MEKTMTPEELNDSLILLQNRFALDKSYKLEDYNIDRLSLINQFKESQIPTESEIDKKRKSKRDEYRSDDAWNRYSDGFMDAVNWFKELLKSNP